jgi:hypothetical protein
MATFNVFVPKANFSFKIDEAKMPKASNDHAHAYGWRQILVDATAQVKRENFTTETLFRAEALKRAKARFQSLVSGTMTTRAAPIDAEAVYAATMGLTVAQLRAAAKAAMDSAKTEPVVNGPLPTAPTAS